MKQVNEEEFVEVVGNYMNKTTEITFQVPVNASRNHKANQCVEQIAQLLDLYFDTSIEDVGNINRLVDEEIVVSLRREAKSNQLDEINGGSR